MRKSRHEVTRKMAASLKHYRLRRRANGLEGLDRETPVTRGHSPSTVLISGRHERSLSLLRKILSEVTPGPRKSDDAIRLRCRRAWRPCEQSPLVTTFGNADEIGKTLV